MKFIMNINKNGENMKKIILFIFTMFVLVLASCNNNNYSKYCEVLKTYENYEGELTQINEYQCDYYSNYELDINIRKIASDKSLINNAFEFDSSEIEAECRTCGDNNSRNYLDEKGHCRGINVCKCCCHAREKRENKKE